MDFELKSWGIAGGFAPIPEIVAHLYGCEIPCRKVVEKSERSTSEDQSKLSARSEDRALCRKVNFSWAQGAPAARPSFFFVN